MMHGQKNIKLVSLTYGKTQPEDVREYKVLRNKFGLKRDKMSGAGGNCIKRSFMACASIKCYSALRS